jgi:hypothetical protein
MWLENSTNTLQCTLGESCKPNGARSSFENEIQDKNKSGLFYVPTVRERRDGALALSDLRLLLNQPPRKLGGSYFWGGGHHLDCCWRCWRPSSVSCVYPAEFHKGGHWGSIMLAVYLWGYSSRCCQLRTVHKFEFQ